ncbi:MAG: hypothetical protein KGH59_04250 [Candidatus Micrarchaeota archaeon]|nr:hypothetical protein [Candidatus Micrarchaeota archaeon]
MADTLFKDRIRHLEVSLSPIKEMVRDGAKGVYSSVFNLVRRNDAAILNAAQNLAISGDGCGLCPTCVIGDTVIGVASIKYFLVKGVKVSGETAAPQGVDSNSSKSATISVLEDDAFRCC